MGVSEEGAGYPLGGRDRSHPDGWHPSRPADDEGPMTGPMPPRGQPPGMNTHAPTKGRGMSMTNSEAVEQLRDVIEKLKECALDAVTLHTSIDEQYQRALAAKAVVNNDDLLPALGAMVDAMEKAREVGRILTDAHCTIEEANG